MEQTPPSPVTFVPLEDGHVLEALEIYNHYVRDTVVTFHDRCFQEPEFRSLLFFEDPRYAAYAALDAATGRLAGYCVLGPYKARGAYRLTAEVTIYLRPEYVGRGLGTAAAHLLEQRAREQGFHALLASICKENRPSARLFDRLGYQQVACRKEVGFKFGRFLDVVEYEKILS